MPSERGSDGPRRWGLWLYAGHLVTIWGIALSNAFLGAMVLLAGRYRRRLARPWPEVAPLLAPLGVYGIFLVAAVAGSYEPAVSAPALRELISLATLALGVVLVRGERAVRLVYDLLLLAITLLAVHGIAQYFFTDYGDLHHRIIGLFSHYQTFAGVLLLGDLLLFARVFAPRAGTPGVGTPGVGTPRRWTWRHTALHWGALHWGALAVINWALFLTLTRGAWVALALTLAAFGLLSAWRTFAVGLAVALAAGAIFVARAPDEWRARVRSIYDLQDASNYDRLCMIEAGLTMVSERPFFGLGPRMVRERYPIYRNPTAPRFTVPHLHNAFLDLAAERGLLSLAAYFWLTAAGLGLAWRAWRREGGRHGPRADLYLGVILALVGFNVAGLFENNWGDTEVQRVVLFLLAVPCCLGARSPLTPLSQRGEPESEPVGEDEKEVVS